MKYHQITPPPQLQPYVRYFAVLENDDADAASTKTFRIIVDGCPGLIFQEDANSFLDKDKNPLPQLFLHGVTTKHAEKTASGNYRNVGVYFQPNAVKAIFGIDANELTNKYTDLSAITSNSPAEQLLNEPNPLQRLEILSQFITRQILQNKHAASTTSFNAISSIKGSSADTTLGQIQHRLNMSERSLERIFKADVGVSPKMFLRINRFQTALNHIRGQAFKSLTKVAYHHDYADQSHYIREFKEFAGVSPKHYLLQANEQAINFPEWKK